MQYLKKITVDAVCGRPMAVEKKTPMMQLLCIINSGQEEATQFGSFIRFKGKFKALNIRDGEIIDEYVSSNAILPSVAEQFIMLGMSVIEEDADAKRPRVAGKFVGASYVPTGSSEYRIAMEIGLQPPAKVREDSRGYEYYADVLYAEGISAVDPLDALTSELQAKGSLRLPAPSSPTPSSPPPTSPAEPSPAETSPADALEHKHRSKAPRLSPDTKLGAAHT